MDNNITPSAVLSEMTYDAKKAYFEAQLLETARPGMDGVVNALRMGDFYTAPASVNNHSNYMGGLLDHSICVYLTMRDLHDSMVRLNPQYEGLIDENSIRISALLHDVCKINFYRQATRYRRNAEGNWEPYQGFEVSDVFPFGHGEKSVILLLSFGLHLTPEEMLAIRWHMGSWDGSAMSYSAQKAYMKASEEHRIVSLLQMADYMSSMMFEAKLEK